ncbi:GH3 auxin-responsive promoter family protein [Aeoliella sp. ICT_H6.2]|uniref:GH3 auxin-responsive promoter family protein n=1 Tax=Aeoliella straminimaris TaxID=2954799 RepID=A0A9X2F951_9BACT|nr:GH3 auxin-responsive promoter family protein [Aeoliella straminimaris]MCO6043897.1 GH3 auxin-responsive promoter family protein [Aeoliella straminimaris]
MQAPIREAILRYKCSQVNRFVAGAQQGRATQLELLLEKVGRAASSDFGKRYGFSSVHDVASFRRQLPITGYEDYRSFIEQVMQGNIEAMFAPKTRVLMFAMTSGTTSEPKRLPVTDRFYNEYRKSWQLWGTGVYRDHQDLLKRQSLQLSSDWQLESTPSGAPVGNISGLAATSRPFYMKRIFALPSCVIKIRDFAAKHYTSLRLGMASDNVGMLITANPSTLVELARRADNEAEALIRDVHDGGISDDYDVPSEIIYALRNRLRPNPKRARQLQTMLDDRGALYPRDYWPHLSVIATWTGGSVGVYLPQLEEFYGNVTIRDHGISASEGRMSIPLADGTPDGLLDYARHYFEFIPAEEHGSHDPTVLEAHELQEGRDYFILLTTSGGLYRYDIHDVVRCTGFVGEMPMLRFLNKGRHFSSITGEKLSEHQVVVAVTKSFEELNLPPCTFTLAPTMGAKPRYELLLESPAHLQKAVNLAQRVQHNLAAVNEEYSDKCRSGRIEAIVIREIPAGTWATLRALRSRARGNFEEFKQPLLVGDVDFINKLPLPAQTITSARAAS